MNLSLTNPLIIGILSAIGGIILAVVTKLGEGWVNEIYENRKAQKEKKQLAAKDITAFCIEGMHKEFRVKAESIQKIRTRAEEIKAIDESVGIKLRQFVDLWSRYWELLKKGSTERTAKKYRNKAQKLGEELLDIAKEWGK